MRNPDQWKDAPPPTNVDRLELVAMAERRKVPVMFVDRHGTPHVVRTPAEYARWTA